MRSLSRFAPLAVVLLSAVPALAQFPYRGGYACSAMSGASWMGFAMMILMMAFVVSAIIALVGVAAFLFRGSLHHPNDPRYYNNPPPPPAT